jgi:hypothetical protein
MSILFSVDVLQWPAMVSTLLAAWLVGSSKPQRRQTGFRMFILSNGLWIAWGWNSAAYALIILQVGLFLLNLRGAAKQLADATENKRPMSGWDSL